MTWWWAPRPTPGTGPYRHAPLREPCSRCEEPARPRCPRCQVLLCKSHSVEPEALCFACAEYELARLSHSGKGAVPAASGLAFSGLVGCAFVSPWFIAMLLVPMLAVLWSGVVTPKLVRRSIRKERYLPRARRQAIERRFLLEARTGDTWGDAQPDLSQG